jgi:hypothetical protein
MSLNLPNPRNVFLPEVPASIKDAATVQYLKDLKNALELQMSKSFDNTYSIVSTGASGSFDATGATITVESGIITSIA